MDQEEIKVNPNTVNCFVIMLITFLYIISRSISSTTPSINVIKGKFRSIAGMLLKLSITSALCYNATLFFLSFKFNIDKVTLELGHRFTERFDFKFKDYSIDLGFVMLTSLKISEALLISSLFLAISLMSSSTHSKTNSNVEPLQTLRNKVRSISRIWGIFRIPFAFYSYYIETLVDEKIYLFFRLIFGSIEFGIATIFIFISRFKNVALKNINVSPAFLSFCCLSYGFLKFTINLVDFPFKLNKTHLEIIISMQFGLLCAIYLLLTEILFPRKFNEVSVKELEVPKQPFSDVSMLETVIVFDEKTGLIKSF